MTFPAQPSVDAFARRRMHLARADIIPAAALWPAIGASATCLGVVTAFSVFLPALARALDVTVAAASIVPSVAIGTQLAGSWVAGSVTSRLGARWSMTVGGILTLIAHVGGSLSAHLWVAVLTLGLFGGLGAALIFLPSLSLVAQADSERKGFWFGLVSFSGGLSGAVIAAASSGLLQVISWRATLRLWALLELVVLMVLLRRVPMGSPEAQAHRAGSHPLAQGAFRWLYAAGLIGSSVYVVPQIFFVVIARAHGLSVGVTGSAVSVYTVVGALGRLGAGWVVDHVGARRALLAATVVLTVGVGLLAIAYQPWVLVLTGTVLGASGGAFVSVPPAMVHEFCPDLDFSRGTGVLLTSYALGAVVCPPLLGALAERAGGFGLPLSITAGTGVLSAACTFQIGGVPHRGRREGSPPG